MAETTDQLLQRLVQSAAALSASQTEALLRDAQQQAEQDLRELLRTACLTAMLRQVLARVEQGAESRQSPSQEGSEAVAPQRDQDAKQGFNRSNSSDGADSSEGSRSQAAAVEPQVEQPGTLEVDATSDLDQSGQHRFGCYVYGVVLADYPQLPAGAPSVDPHTRPTLVRSGRLQAITSRIELDEFVPEPHAPQRDLEWVEEKVRSHDHLLKIAAEQGPLAPLQFGSVFACEADVIDLLTEHEQRFVDLLQSLHGKSEWGVKLFYGLGSALARSSTSAASGDGGATAATAAAKSSAADTSPNGSGGGRAYLHEKRRQQQQIADAKATIRSAAQQCHELLSAAADDAVALPLQKLRAADRRDEMLLNGSYLLDPSQIRPFHDIVDRLTQQYQPLGMRLELTGPWPLYNFANLQFASDAEDESAVARR